MTDGKRPKLYVIQKKVNCCCVLGMNILLKFVFKSLDMPRRYCDTATVDGKFNFICKSCKKKKKQKKNKL